MQSGVIVYTNIIRPILFKMDAERAHHWAVRGLSSPLARPFLPSGNSLAFKSGEALRTALCGIQLKHPVGLAAGFDKDAKMLQSLPHLGFSFVEVGTVTAKPQPGNPKPRLFRLPKDCAVVNRMGFNNEGVDVAVSRLQKAPSPLPIGGNIGKSKITPLESASEDYLYSLRALVPFVDYFVVNVSSPNTPGLRELQAKQPLKNLLQCLSEANEAKKPLLLKIAPDLSSGALEDIVEVVEACGVDGVIATNTTIAREGLISSQAEVSRCGAGGLSGLPLKGPSLEVLAFLRKNLPQRVALVGVGGIFTGQDALEKIMAGASCVQIYTGLIYRGPKTVALILEELQKALALAGFRSVQEAIGAAIG